MFTFFNCCSFNLYLIFFTPTLSFCLWTMKPTPHKKIYLNSQKCLNHTRTSYLIVIIPKYISLDFYDYNDIANILKRKNTNNWQTRLFYLKYEMVLTESLQLTSIKILFCHDETCDYSNLVQFSFVFIHLKFPWKVLIENISIL